MGDRPDPPQLTQWDWTSVCPTGVRPWLPDTKELAPCFQQLFLQIPVLCLFAIVSGYHVGRIAVGPRIQRSLVQRVALRVRMMAVLALVGFAVFKYMYAQSIGMTIWLVDVLIGCLEIVVFSVHLGEFGRGYSALN